MDMKIKYRCKACGKETDRLVEVEWIEDLGYYGIEHEPVIEDRCPYCGSADVERRTYVGMLGLR